VAFAAAESEDSGIIADKGDALAGVAGLRTEIARLNTHLDGSLTEISFCRFSLSLPRDNFSDQKFWWLLA
jgi:hypothetical protein